jgi:excisionase family DNA binding protein
MRLGAQAGHEVALAVPDELLHALAERTAALVAERLERAPQIESPWLDFEGAVAYLGFSRDRLYKLTAARAIPFRKKRNGQGLLFHRDELDRWVEAEYESTGCTGEVELWSTTTQQMPRRRRNAPGPATEV